MMLRSVCAAGRRRTGPTSAAATTTTTAGVVMVVVMMMVVMMSVARSMRREFTRIAAAAGRGRAETETIHAGLNAGRIHGFRPHESTFGQGMIASDRVAYNYIKGRRWKEIFRR